MKTDMRELLMIERKIDDLLGTGADVSRKDLDDALFYAKSMQRRQAEVKYGKLRRLYEYQQHQIEIRTPTPIGERVTAEQVEEAHKKAIADSTIKSRAAWAILKREFDNQTDRDAEIAEIKRQDEQQRRELAKEQKVQSEEQKTLEKIQGAYQKQVQANNAAFDAVNQ